MRRQSGYGFVYYSTLPEGVEAAIAASRELADQTIDNVNYKSSLSHNLMKNLQPEVNSDMENMSNGANRSAPPRSTAHSHGSAHESSSPTGGVGDTASASKHGHTQLSAHASVQTVQHPPSHAAVSHHQQLQQVAPPPPPPVMHDGYAVHYGPPSHPEAGMYMVNPSSMAVYPAPQVMHGSPVLPYNSFVQPLPPPASGMYPALVPGAPMMAPESMFAPNSPANSYRAFPSPGQSMRGPMLPMGPAGGMGMMPGVYLSVPPQPMHQSPALSSQSADSVREEQLSYLHYLVSPATPYYAGMSPTALAASSPLMGHGYAPGYHQDAYYGRSPRHAQPSGVWATGVEPAGGNHVADAPRSIRPARSVSSRARQTLISEATGSSNAQR